VSLANFITLGRLLSVPVATWLVLSGDMKAAFWLFVAAGLSDAVDGFVAKRFDQRSELGALLDPLADKTLLVSMYVTLGIEGFLPNWLVILVVFRDLFIVGGFLLAMAVTQPIRSRPLAVSKVNTVLQITLVAVVLARAGLGVGEDHLTQALIYAVGLSTIVSGGGYLVRWGRVLAGAEPGA
jgi:cardiolipin synthase (CMP-forming)